MNDVFMFGEQAVVTIDRPRKSIRVGTYVQLTSGEKREILSVPLYGGYPDIPIGQMDIVIAGPIEKGDYLYY